MRLTRKVIRIFLLLGWFAATSFIALCFRFLPEKISVRAISRVTKIWGAGIARIIGMKVFINGDIEKVRGFFIVSNHLGYLDIIAHSSIFPIRFTPKSDIASWPLMGWVVALSRPVWIRRESRQSAGSVLKEFARTLDYSVNMIVYPEGTSSDGRKGALQFKSSVFEAPIRGNFPVLPILTSYPGQTPEDVCWFGGMTLLPHVWNVLGIKEISVRVDILEPVEPGGLTRRELAANIHSRLNEKFKETLI
jgi:1-acyl-sn-glycerol-3-phosphate acyltransferase